MNQIDGVSLGYNVAAGLVGAWARRGAMRKEAMA
jgi:hypothetical protein